MSKRLQVLLEEEEMRQIRQAARRRRMTVAEWVRQALRAAQRGEPRTSSGRKREALREAVRHEFPAGPIEEMLAQIERGYAGQSPR